MRAHGRLEDLIQAYREDTADAALRRLIEARQGGAAPEKVALLRKAYERAWLAASYVRSRV